MNPIHSNLSSVRSIKIADRYIGDDHPCFITYEAGPTHDGINSAIKLVQEAAKSGADAVKFQIFDVDRLVSDKKQLFKYSILKDRENNTLEEISEPLYDILKRRSLTNNEWKKVKKEADKLKLAFFATVGFEEDLELLMELNCHSIKIASADVDHFPLLRLAARSGMNVQLDTGNADISEINKAVELLEKEGCNSIIIHQCPSGYPAHLPSVCLRMIKKLREIFPKYPIAYSDHTPEADLDIAAVAMGANLVEKTITLNRMTPSVEHVFSLEPKDMSLFIKRIRDVEIALGSRERILSAKQKEDRKLVRRSPYSLFEYKKGTLLSQLKVDFRRPGIGVTPSDWEIALLSNGKLTKDIYPNDRIEYDSISLQN